MQGVFQGSLGRRDWNLRKVGKWGCGLHETVQLGSTGEHKHLHLASLCHLLLLPQSDGASTGILTR